MTLHSKNAPGTHRHNLYLAIICLAVLAVAFLLTVSRDLGTRRQLEAQLSEASRLADRRQALIPLMAELQKNDAAFMPGSEGLPGPSPLSESSVEEYEKVIEQMLLQCNLKQTALTPDIHSILSDKGYILIDLSARGAFSHFRDLILRIGRLPFVSGIEQFRLQRPAEKNGLEMFLKLRIQVDSAADNAHENQ